MRSYLCRPKPMKIAMIGQKGLPATYGGVERHVHDLAVRLVKTGHHITAYSRAWYNGGKTTPVQGVAITLLPSLKTKHLDTITHTALASFHALSQNFDIIHYHGVGPALMAWIPRVFSPKTKVLVTFHSIDRHHQKWGIVAKLLLRLGEWAACRFAHATITVSKNLQNYCWNEYKRNAIYIPNGTMTRHTEKITARHLAQFKLTPDQYLIMVARLIPNKGAHLLIEAFQHLKKRQPPDAKINQLKLVIVGGSVHTDKYVTRLKKASAGSSDIVFTGFQSGPILRELFGNAYAAVHPSLSEGLPISVLEAMSFGKAILVSDIAEHLELLKDARILFAQNSVRALEQTLFEFLNQPESVRKEIGEANRRTVRQSYSWDVVVPQTIAVYESLLEKIPLTSTAAVV